MVRHHLRLREPGWRFGMAINGVGAVTTGLIAAIVVISKFTEGAWIPAVLIPVMVVGFRAIGRHYQVSRAAVVAEPGYRPRRETHTMVVLVGGVNKGVLHGIQYARSLHPDRIVAVTVASDDEDRQRIEATVGASSRSRSNCTPSTRPYRELTTPDHAVHRRARLEARGRHHHRRHPRVRHHRGAPSGSTTAAPSRSRPGCCTGRTPPSCRYRST